MKKKYRLEVSASDTAFHGANTLRGILRATARCNPAARCSVVLDAPRREVFCGSLYELRREVALALAQGESELPGEQLY